MHYVFFCFFFFQAEDGIRDLTVTGVQTCALPISGFPDWPSVSSPNLEGGIMTLPWPSCSVHAPSTGSISNSPRSEEHTSELQSQSNLVCRLLLEKKKKNVITSCSVILL